MWLLNKKWMHGLKCMQYFLSFKAYTESSIYSQLRWNEHVTDQECITWMCLSKQSMKLCAQ